MAYWGTTYWPSRLPSSAVSARKIINTVSSSGGVPFKSKITKVQAYSSSAPALHLNTKDITRQIGIKATAEGDILAVTPLGVMARAQSGGISNIVNKNSVGSSVAYIIGESKTSFNKDTLGESVVCVPIKSSSNIYYWTCFEGLDEDDNLTKLIRDCRGE